MNQILRDDLIFLRALEPTDLDIMYEWENDSRLWEVGNTITPYSRQQLWEYLKNYDGDIYTSHQLRLMVCLNETREPIGTVDFYDFDPFNQRGAVGLLIAEKFQRKGLGQRTLKLTLNYALDYLGLHQCISIIPTDNTASINLFRKAGFDEVGTLKDWLKIGQKYKDALFMQRMV